MRKRPVTRALLLLLVTAIGLGGCAAEAPPAAPAETEAVQTNTLEVEIMDFSHETEHVIYLAGGCFWGLEQLMQSIPGVIDAESGYANGTGEQDANYSAVCAGDTGFRETVRVAYDPEQVSLDALLLAYFYVIDPTVQNRQGNDIGTQYQTGVYYTNDAAKETVERIAELERSVYACLRMTSDIIMITAVPASMTGGLLKAIRSVIPRTEPGTIYGNMAMVSSKPVSQLFLLTETATWHIH